MDKMIALPILILFFSLGCYNQKEETQLSKNYRNFTKCLWEKSGFSEEDKQKLFPMSELDAKLANIEQKCTDAEKHEITEVTGCVLAKCGDNPSPIEFEQLLKKCGMLELPKKVSEECEKAAVWLKIN